MHDSGRDSGQNPLPGDLSVAAALGGEMGRRFAEFDWAAHPLGAPHTWSSEIRAAVAVALTSRFPIVLWLGAKDLFLLYNDAYIPMLSDKHPAALGRHGRDVWWDIWDAIGPMLGSVAATKAATWSNDLMLPLVTGGRAEERYFTFSYSPVLGGTGAVSAIFCAVTETTERVLGERRLHVLNAVASAVIRARTIEDAVAAAVEVCATQPADLPFIAVYVADSESATLRGATPLVAPLLPRSLAALIHGPPAPPRSRTAVQVVDRLAAVIPGIDAAFPADCPEQALVVPLSAVDGAVVIGTSPRRPFDAQYRGFCQLLADQLSSALASAVSYEQQRQRADELAELDQAKTAFLTNVSHEFRTPLTLLLGPVDDALAEADPDSALADRLKAARRNAGRLLRLVDALLDFSRIEANRATVTLVCTDVGVLTARIASSFSELCQRAGLSLVVDCEPALADIDAAMWETIVLNLLSNAVKFTLEGSIAVEVESTADGCRIGVRDTGVGIAPEHVSRLFERFYRVGDARGRSVEGTGIGLSLVRALVELQAGTVEIESEPNRGTAVTICLPEPATGTAVDHAPRVRVDDANPYVVEAGQWLAQIPDIATVSAVAGRNRALILIADDNADMRAHLDRVLAARWETVLAADGESALVTARRCRPDAIVTDVMMPGLSGFDFVAAVRADPTLASTPVVILSARAGAEAVSEGITGGADDYLAKPFASRELIDRVAARLSAVARERAGHRQPDEQMRRAGALVALDAKLQAADSVTAILDAVLDFAVGATGGASAGIGVLDTDRNVLRMEYAGMVPAELRDRYHVVSVDGPLPMGDVVTSGEPLIVADSFALDPRDRGSLENDAAGSIGAGVVHPLWGRAGRVTGVLLLMWPAPRAFDAAELEMLARTAQITQAAVDRVLITRHEHRIAVDFQQQLLDLDHSSTAAVVAAVYRPATEAMRVGGDWYLVTPIERPGRVGISVGDVVGHGLSAAIAMSRLRAAVASAALTAPEPAAVLTVLDRYAAAVPGGRCATVSYAVVDTETATMSYACAGHPYPLVVPPDGPPTYLASGRRPPVAAWENGTADATAHTRLAPASLVLMYTDGLIERSGEDLDQGFARLKAVAAQCACLPVAQVCDQVLEQMTPPGGYTDDVVVLAVRPNHSAPRSFTTVLPAALAQVPVARRQLRTWLRTAAIDPRREYDILLATGEAVTNAIEHGGYGDPRNNVSIEAFLHADALAVTVSDAGWWSRDSSASYRTSRRGRGLTLIHGLADRVDTVRTAQGTRVTLEFDDAKPVSLQANGR